MYKASRPVPNYSPTQVRGYQRMAFTSSGTTASYAALRMGDIYTTPSPQQAADPIRAARWYAYSAHMGNASAAYSLGQLYLTGEGVPVDPTRGYALVSWASSSGDPEAQAFLASNPPPPTDAIDSSAPLPLPPPPLATPPPDNSTSSGTDVIADLLVGTVLVGGLFALLGSSNDAPPSSTEESHVSFKACVNVDAAKVLGLDTSGINANVETCLH